MRMLSIYIFSIFGKVPSLDNFVVLSNVFKCFVGINIGKTAIKYGNSNAFTSDIIFLEKLSLHHCNLSFSKPISGAVVLFLKITQMKTYVLHLNICYKIKF